MSAVAAEIAAEFTGTKLEACIQKNFPELHLSFFECSEHIQIIVSAKDVRVTLYEHHLLQKANALLDGLIHPTSPLQGH